MRYQVIARLAVALILVCAFVCITVGAVKIQESRIYPAGSNPGSSPAMVGTGAFQNSVTAGVAAPYKTNSWLSPVFWADSTTLIYPDNGYITSGEKHAMYQLPIYPLPWSIYYCKTPPLEARNLFANLNTVDPSEQSQNLIAVPQGLFMRPMPVYPLYDTQLQLPNGGYDPTTSQYNIYDLSGAYSAPSMRLDPGINASHIRISRMGDYDAGLLLSDADDPARQGSSQGTSLAVDTVRGSPFIHLTLNNVPALNLSFWHGRDFTHTTQQVTTGGKNITCEIISTQFKSYGAPGATINWDQASFWDNQTMIFFYPTGSAAFSQQDRDPIYRTYGEKPWLYNRTDASFSFANPVGPGYMVVATVPSSDFTDTSTLEALASAAFQYPTGSAVAYSYSPDTAAMQATYTLQTSDVIGTGGTPLQGLLPLHYGAFFGKPPVLSSTPQWLKNGSGVQMITESILGDVKYLSGNSFTCTYQYPGILPYIPGLPAQDTTGIANLSKWLQNVESMIASPGWGNWKYTGMANGPGTDTYGAGKRIWSASNIYRTAQGVETQISADAADSAARSVSLFFADTPSIITSQNVGQAPYYSYYDPNASTIILYPAATGSSWPPNDVPILQWDGYGTATVLNDHHYTWGYYINAAAEIALDNATWMQAHKNVINQLVFDVAYDPAFAGKNQFSYPKMRFFDPYTGHCQAGGMTYKSQFGNNEESMSEEMHFWSGVIRWGSASGQSDIEAMGIIHYTQAMYAYFTFWRDHFNNYPKLWSNTGSGLDPLWFSSNYVSQMWDGKAKYTTHFGSHPAPVNAITILPMTGGSFYHAADPTGIQSQVSSYLAYVKKWNIDPMNPQGTVWQDGSSPWAGLLGYYGEMACWYALVDPVQAQSTFFPLNADTALTPDPVYKTMPMNQFTEGGKSAAEVYHFIRFLEDYGRPEPLAVHATNTAYFMTFVKGDGRTYVGYNPTNTPMDITFSDGKVITGVAPHQFGFWPSGIPGPVKASFTATPRSGTAPMQVNFTDTSSGQIASWSWSFGDGGSSTDQNPTHTYTSEGAFSVTLTVTDIYSKTSTYSDLISVRKSGALPGNFSISTLQQSGGTMGLYPSLAVNGTNQSYVSYFNSPETMPWAEGMTGSIGVLKIDTSTQPITITKEKNAVDLTYHQFPDGVAQPEWGVSSLTLDSGKNPIVSYTMPGSASPYYPQSMYLSYEVAGGWGQSEVTNNFPWNPSVAVPTGDFPTIGYVSGTGKNANIAFNPPKDYTQAWGTAPVEPNGDASTFTPTVAFLTHLYTGSEQTARMVYYNSSTQEIRHAWLPNKQVIGAWQTEVVMTQVNAGWASAAYNPDSGNLGVCWYDLGNKSLKFIEKPVNGAWGSPEPVDSSGHDVGAGCSLAYGPASGKLPGPGISYYDATTRSLMFAWKDGQGWHTTQVDTGGAGTSGSLAYSSDGYPRIAYRHEDSNALKFAYLTEGTGISASFTSDVQHGMTPLTVRFSDQTIPDTAALMSASDGFPIEIEVHYWWDLDGDGEWEEEDNPDPVYTYTMPGSYSVRMLIEVKMTFNFFGGQPMVFDIWGVADNEDYIRATGGSAANFTASPFSGTPPLVVNFTDTSEGNFSAWNWTFGDGTESHEQNPVHTYTGIGTYSVTLEVSGEEDSAIIRKPAVVQVNTGRVTGQTGMLKISSEPSDAEIFIDSIYQAQTPVDSLIAKAGTRAIRLHKDGYQDWNGNAQVRGGTGTVVPKVRLMTL